MPEVSLSIVRSYSPATNSSKKGQTGKSAIYRTGQLIGTETLQKKPPEEHARESQNYFIDF